MTMPDRKYDSNTRSRAAGGKFAAGNPGKPKGARHKAALVAEELRERDPMSTLTSKQDRFVAEYLVDLNATQAAIRAGYSKKTAQRIGSENLSKPLIAAAIQKSMTKRSERTDIKADDVIRELAKIAFANMEDYTRLTKGGGLVLDATNLTRDQKAAISEVSYDAQGNPKIKLADKRAALVDLGRHFALFTDNTVVDVKIEDAATTLQRAKESSERLGFDLPVYLLGDPKDGT
jgi:phage terminase small subunit